MNRAKVSVLIPCYNAERWISQCVESALNQSWPELEVIVIDDGSTDGSAGILDNWSGRAQVICRENRGGNVTRNELLECASGEWVQFLDADDFLLPDKIEKQMELVLSQPEAVVVYSPLKIEHQTKDGVIFEDWNPHNLEGDHDPWSYHLSWDLTQTGGALFHRVSLLEAGGWNEDQPCCQDNEVFFRLLKMGYHFVRCGYSGAIYRRFEGGSVSTRRMSLVRDEILRLVDEGERWLASRDELTQRRRQAANQNRLALARGCWLEDPSIACKIIERIRQSDPGFRPEPAPHAPAAYRLAWRLFGFEGAERISEWKRKITRQ